MPSQVPGRSSKRDHREAKLARPGFAPTGYAAAVFVLNKFRTKTGGGLAAFRKFSLPSVNTSKVLYLQCVESFRLPFSASLRGKCFSPILCPALQWHPYGTRLWLAFRKRGFFHGFALGDNLPVVPPGDMKNFRYRRMIIRIR